MEQLKEGDIVIFTIKGKKYKYIVYRNFLKEEYACNDKIFIALKLDKVKFANYAYGYESLGGNWPESRYRDFAALTRLVEALFPYCDEVTVDGKIVYSKSEKTISTELKSFISSSKSESSDIIDFESIVQTSKIKLNFI